ncbi:MAG TPA: hypothetical protein PLX73_02640 [Candidatus Paceibacterota bacterium]|nr:hypothetical protein [Candidatus Paceibacterota bacterium]HOK20890.1 hypothetical protein [Candidatus Paceibacterota bacterium]HON21805.1 hypothetical protein [Candidatus Paceibacterota bacterium]HPP17251.1 hypothetical protein [Candidatus Paceibacterota bacterium]
MKKELIVLVGSGVLFLLYILRPWGNNVEWLTAVIGFLALGGMLYCLVLEGRDQEK